MSEGRSGPVRVRVAGHEIQFPDLESARRALDAGQIGASAEVRLPGAESWVPLSQALSGPRARKDPWAVWEEADSADPADLYSRPRPEPEAPRRPEPPRRAVEEPQELPSAALSPVEDERARAGPKFVIDASKRSNPPSPPPPASLPPPAGKVIAFPSARVQPSRHALDPETLGPLALEPAPAEPVQLRPPPPPPRPVRVLTEESEPPAPPVRWARVGLLLGVGALLLLLGRWYVVGQATEPFPPTPQLPTPGANAPPTSSATSGAPQVPSASSAPVEPAAPTSPEEAYAELQERLRALLLPDVREVPTEEAIEDALLVELNAVRLDVVRVEASVRGWAGKRREQPKVVELSIHLRGEPAQIDWDLGATGLVVGKYVQRYGWELPRFEVVFEGVAENPQRMALNPEASRLLYLDRKSLLEYLRTRPG